MRIASSFQRSSVVTPEFSEHNTQIGGTRWRLVRRIGICIRIGFLKYTRTISFNGCARSWIYTTNCAHSLRQYVSGSSADTTFQSGLVRPLLWTLKEFPLQEFSQLEASLSNKSLLEIDKLPVAALSFEKSLRLINYPTIRIGLENRHPKR